MYSKGRPRRFVMLDRDGTINVERNYLSHPDDLELLPGVVAGLAHLRDLGLGLVVVTNQSGVGRGYFDLERLEAIHQWLRALLRKAGVALDGIYFCPHLPDGGCGCRKPAPGLVRQAEADLGFDARQGFVIGDNGSDIALGRAIGAWTILVTTGYGQEALADPRVKPDFSASSLAEAASVIESCLRRDGMLPGRTPAAGHTTSREGTGR